MSVRGRSAPSPVTLSGACAAASETLGPGAALFTRRAGVAGAAGWRAPGLGRRGAASD